jgi:RimJ/RimL family protein N-acetyltransferase
MHIEEFDPAADADRVRAWYQLYAATEPLDAPGGPVRSERTFCTGMRLGWPGERREAVLAAGPDGAWAGGYTLTLPEKENRHLAWLTLLVAPERRRSGLGTKLLRDAAGRAAARGRIALTAETRIGLAGSAFAAATGARPGLVEVRRVLELTDAPAGKLAALRGAAEAASRGYSLVCWQGPTPDEYLDQAVAVANAMADAPRNPGEEPEVDDAERVRHAERNVTEQGVHFYSVAARCDSSGELAGLTQLGVDPLNPSWGHQWLTAVSRAHRGHRLGLLVKVAMLEWLAQAEPGLRRIVTGNAGTNQHMIAINAELGFRVLDEWQSWELDVAAVPAAASLSRPGGAAR